MIIRGLNKHKYFIFVALFVLVGSISVSNLLAVASDTVNIDFSTEASQPIWHHYENNQIRIQRNGGIGDEGLLESIGTQNERSFVRLDKWKPTADSKLITEQGRYGLGDSWLDNMNKRGVAPWLTQEVDAWKKGETGWYINPPLNSADYQDYESLWYDVVKYVKNKSPQTTIIESFNESNCGCVSRNKKLSTDEQVELYARNAMVVNRINQELQLPKAGSPALVSGGPSFIGAGLANGDMEAWLNALYNRQDFEDIKPQFVSIHNFTSKGSPSDYKTLADQTRNLMNDSKFAGAWDKTEIWFTAYNITGNDNTITEPSPSETARWTAGMAAAHHYMEESNVANASMFAQSNNYNPRRDSPSILKSIISKQQL